MGKINKILGLDYGKKRIGVAIGLKKEKIFLPFGIIENKDFIFVLAEIKKIIKEDDLDLIVVGLPVSLSGETKSEQFKNTLEFIEKLKKEISLEVVGEDERLTSREAKDLLLGGKMGKRDDVAAMLILKSYLNKN